MPDSGLCLAGFCLASPRLAKLCLESELVLATACFGCFVWGTGAHFRRHGEIPGGTRVISLLSCAGFLDLVWDLCSRPAQSGSWARMAGTSTLILGAVGLWAWAVRATRARPPTLAYTEDEPEVLFQQGPYRWVRHPFYTAYMIFWLAAALAGAEPVGFAVCLMLGAIYYAAARHEERKFARSALAAVYADYRARAGMFLPRF